MPTLFYDTIKRKQKQQVKAATARAVAKGPKQKKVQETLTFIIKNGLTPSQAMKLTDDPCAKQYIYRQLAALKVEILARERAMSTATATMAHPGESKETGSDDGTSEDSPILSPIGMSYNSIISGDSWWSKYMSKGLDNPLIQEGASSVPNNILSLNEKERYEIALKEATSQYKELKDSKESSDPNNKSDITLTSIVRAANEKYNLNTDNAKKLITRSTVSRYVQIGRVNMCPLKKGPDPKFYTSLALQEATAEYKKHKEKKGSAYKSVRMDTSLVGICDAVNAKYGLTSKQEKVSSTTVSKYVAIDIANDSYTPFVRPAKKKSVPEVADYVHA